MPNSGINESVRLIVACTGGGMQLVTLIGESGTWYSGPAMSNLDLVLGAFDAEEE